MKISIITLFPSIFEEILNTSITLRAQKKKLVKFEIINLRDFGEGRHQVVDGRPYGGGAGMVLRADILAKALNSIKKGRGAKVILTAASGNPYNQKKARELSGETHLIIICGHYEGVDQRFIDKYVDQLISVGDFILTGGEIPALMIADSITRLIPGVLEKEEATLNESFENGFLEHPHYTRPEEFEEEGIPPVLVSGHHGEVKNWRDESSKNITRKLRPDLLKKSPEKS